jgi:hypothetical protein
MARQAFNRRFDRPDKRFFAYSVRPLFHAVQPVVFGCEFFSGVELLHNAFYWSMRMAKRERQVESMEASRGHRAGRHLVRGSGSGDVVVVHHISFEHAIRQTQE